jgi:parallel beta-helix repeat protein
MLCGVITVTFGHAAAGAQFFVATYGSNAAAGTADAPWQTLQFAADRVAPGDRVVVRPGAYTGFYLDTSGTPAAPIEFLAEPGVLINQRNTTTPDGINLEGASHILIDGFAVTGMERAGVRSVGFPSNFAEHVTVRNVHAYNNARWGIFTGHVDDLLIESNVASGSAIEHGIYVSNSGDRPVIRDNLIFDNHGSGIHMNGDLSQGGDGIISHALVSRNVIYNNAAPDPMNNLGGGSGINMDGVQNSRIENNLLYNNHASGISLYSIDGAQGSIGNVVVNNTVHQPSNGRWALNIKDGSTGNTALNNILISDHAFRGAIDISADSMNGFVSDYNVVISRFNAGSGTMSLAQWQAQTGNDAHSSVANATSLFVNPGAADYHLRANSPAVNEGTATHAPAVDFEGDARPANGAYDIGADEAPSADFNSDGIVNHLDIDQLAWAAQNEPQNLVYDLNGDQEVAYSVSQSGTMHSDSDQLVRQLVDILDANGNKLRNGTEYGDLDLDGDVSLGDLDRLVFNYRKGGQFRWADGNIDGSQQAGTSGDPRITLSDLDLLVSHYRFEAAAAAALAIPEPTASALFFWGVFAFFCADTRDLAICRRVR